MNYTKPEIASLASASSAIQGVPKSSDIVNDYKNIDLVTLNAYEADE
jgi:hypothetical protein